VVADKVLTDRAVAAVKSLRDADILFAVTSGRPPRGMSMMMDPLDLQTPIAAFNGGLIVDRDMRVLEQRVLPEPVVKPITELLRAHALDVWVYRARTGPSTRGPHVDREPGPWFSRSCSRSTADGRHRKLVGVSDGHGAVARASAGATSSASVSAASQPYYVDVTHPAPNKGGVAKYLSAVRDTSRSYHRRHADDVLMFVELASASRWAMRPAFWRARQVTTNDDEAQARLPGSCCLPQGECRSRRRRLRLLSTAR
jgi:hydroxymethylpyrimidine pyrophosphatase-like HAD family hydrolase